jgi:hypothetical protein
MVMAKHPGGQAAFRGLARCIRSSTMDTGSCSWLNPVEGFFAKTCLPAWSVSKAPSIIVPCSRRALKPHSTEPIGLH